MRKFKKQDSAQKDLASQIDQKMGSTHKFMFWFKIKLISMFRNVLGFMSDSANDHLMLIRFLNKLMSEFETQLFKLIRAVCESV